MPPFLPNIFCCLFFAPFPQYLLCATQYLQYFVCFHDFPLLVRNIFVCVLLHFSPILTLRCAVSSGPAAQHRGLPSFPAAQQK